MTNTLINRANAAHNIIMDIFYDDLFSLTDGASSTILEAANSIADPVGDQLTEERYKDGIEKLSELL